MRYLLVIFGFCLSANGVRAQIQAATAPAVMPVDTFVQMVLQHHPVARQARLLRRQAQAQQMKARGSFDPKLYADVQEKNFQEKDYYDLQKYGLKVPTWFGLSANGGFERNTGVFLNPENNVPSNGLLFAELSLTLGKGLFIDERRAALKQAQLLQKQAEYQIQLALNDLLVKALDSYWRWYNNYREVIIYEEAITLAQERYQGVYSNANIGESALVDTLEAYLQVQNRRLQYQEALGNLAQSQNKAATFLWLNGQVPLEIDSLTQPQNRATNAPLLQANWLQNHPWLQFYRLKQNRLEVEQKFAREQLKPQVDLRYKFLTENTGTDFVRQYNPQDYEWGVSMSFPLFLRKERGELNKVQLKMQDNALTLQQKQRELDTKVRALQQQWTRTRNQLNEALSMTENYRQLWQAEITKFENGESSLFLINSRETKYLQSRAKVAALQAKVQQVEAKLRGEAALLAP